MPSLDYKSPQPLLSASGLVGREGNTYRAHPDLIAAANAALAIQRPLLLTGEAGCGKTDFAFAAASGLGRHPQAGEGTTEALECYVRSDSRARDLLYSYDAIRRFGDAQSGGKEGKERAQNPRFYIRLEALGQALLSPVLRVVLVDEIDKAPRDLPNDLLRELDQARFEIPEIPSTPGSDGGPIDLEKPETYRRIMELPGTALRPLVIITSNVERQLPDPFLRRCVFFHIPFPDTVDLTEILRSRFPGDSLQVDRIGRIVDVFEAVRSFSDLTKKPSTAELIHWTEGLQELYGLDAACQTLDRLVGGRSAKGRHHEIRWQELPLLGCLTKLREDQRRLLEAGVR